VVFFLPPLPPLADSSLPVFPRSASCSNGVCSFISPYLSKPARPHPCPLFAGSFAMPDCGSFSLPRKLTNLLRSPSIGMLFPIPFPLHPCFFSSLVEVIIATTCLLTFSPPRVTGKCTLTVKMSLLVIPPKLFIPKRRSYALPLSFIPLNVCAISPFPLTDPSLPQSVPFSFRCSFACYFY